MTTRLDKNGIPVLDPPGRNGIRNPTPCLPDEHNWGPPFNVDESWDWIMDEGSEQFEQRCRRCGVRDRFWRPFGGRGRE